METFLKVIEKIISLIKARDENRVKLFKEIVEPLNAEFEKIAVQYFAFFGSALSNLEQGGSLEETISSLKSQRNDYIQARIKLVSMTKAIRETLGNPDVVEYCDSVADFFFPENYIMYEMSMGEELLKELEGYFEEGGIENDGRSLRVIIQYIDSALRTIELYWSEAASNYARLRVNYLLSQQIKFKNS